MKKEELLKKYNEVRIFNELKDVYFEGINDMKRRYRNVDVDFYSIYRRIINYRIKKYGTSLFVNPNNYNIRTREDSLKLAYTCNKRKKRLLEGGKRGKK